MHDERNSPTFLVFHKSQVTKSDFGLLAQPYIKYKSLNTTPFISNECALSFSHVFSDCTTNSNLSRFTTSTHKQTQTQIHFALLAKPQSQTQTFPSLCFTQPFCTPSLSLSLSFSFYPSPPPSFYPCNATKLEQLRLNMISQNYAIMPRLEIRPNSFSVITCRAVSTTTTTVTPLADIKAKPADPISLQSTWQHRAWVAAGSVAILSPLYKSISLVATAPSPVAVFEPAIAALFGYLMADLGSGFYHWAIDNYGDASTPFFGSQIDAFQVNNQLNRS